MECDKSAPSAETNEVEIDADPELSAIVVLAVMGAFSGAIVGFLLADQILLAGAVFAALGCGLIAGWHVRGLAGKLSRATIKARASG